jgi:hypothetical protein
MQIVGEPSTSLVSLGELTKPATVLIEKISDAVGGLFRPYQIVRVAKAEAAAERLHAEAAIEVTDLHRRAFHRFLQEEAQKQKNMEAVTAMAVPQLSSSAEPEIIDQDWLVNFFDKCRLTSDREVQQVWSKILAGEANNPGSFSRRTVNCLAALDKSDAEHFKALCSFCCEIPGSAELTVPIILDTRHAIYAGTGVTFSPLIHLESIGLIQFERVADFQQIGLPKYVTITYVGSVIKLIMPDDTDNRLPIGKVLLTKIGLELAPISGGQRIEGFAQYLVGVWRDRGYLPIVE